MRKDIAGPEGESTRPMWESLEGAVREKAQRNLSTTMGHSTGLIREQCPVW